MIVCIDTNVLVGMFGRRAPEFIELVDETRGVIRYLSPAYRFLTIPADADDDKFADCAIAAHADYVITEDRHFRSLAGAGYKPQPITPEAFITQHLGGQGTL
ncbi:MAG: hypothetical protein NTV80_18895 [Verrucomicrobia bacterium]|nr:hypothetical protein [Verrucomicrobiota bacterium]